MKNRNSNSELYKKMICDAVMDVEDPAQLRRIYSVVCRQSKGASPMAAQLQEIVQGLSPADQRLLYITALELKKGGRPNG